MRHLFFNQVFLVGVELDGRFPWRILTIRHQIISLGIRRTEVGSNGLECMHIYFKIENHALRVWLGIYYQLLESRTKKKELPGSSFF